jgi:PAB-dependent poly(A)-specific ribonuclease subunit 2
MDGNRDKPASAATAQSTLIQNFNRWLMSTFTTEAFVDGQQALSLLANTVQNMSISSTPPSTINQVLGIAVKTTNRCMACQYVTVRESTLQTVDLSYPRKPASGDAHSFADTLRAAIVRSSTTKANCSNCKNFAPLDSRRDLASSPAASLPPVLSVNAMVSTSEQLEVWKDRSDAGKIRHFLPSRVSFRAGEKGEVVTDDSGEGVTYEVKSVVVQVQTSPDSPAHLLSFSKSKIKPFVSADILQCRLLKTRTSPSGSCSTTSSFAPSKRRKSSRSPILGKYLP